MTRLLVAVTVFLVAAFGWTFFEYVLHRFAFHETRGKWYGSRQHLDHHTRANWIFDRAILLAWFGVLLVGAGLMWGGSALFGPWIGLPWGLGWIFGYFFYEWHHAQAHLRGPKNRWERFVRKQHFHHHFGHPLRNQGVTTNLWDIVFGTLDRPDRVRIPSRLAPVWLVDSDGVLLPQYAADYEVVGRRNRPFERRRDDHDRSYANEPPIVEIEPTTV